MYYRNAIQLQSTGNLEKVFELYACSAELGNAIAQYNLVMMYSNGASVMLISELLNLNATDHRVVLHQ